MEMAEKPLGAGIRITVKIEADRLLRVFREQELRQSQYWDFLTFFLYYSHQL
jgi:hypothetical protein